MILAGRHNTDWNKVSFLGHCSTAAVGGGRRYFGVEAAHPNTKIYYLFVVLIVSRAFSNPNLLQLF